MSDIKSECSSVNMYGNIWVREVVLLRKGDTKGGHKHEFDHVHFIHQGTVKILTMNDDKEVLDENEYTAPAWIKVPKEVFHRIVALEDMCVGYCMQALRDEDGEIMDTDYVKDLKNEKK